MHYAVKDMVFKACGDISVGRDLVRVCGWRLCVCVYVWRPCVCVCVEAVCMCVCVRDASNGFCA